jgi:hypothetical protein
MNQGDYIKHNYQNSKLEYLILVKLPFNESLYLGLYKDTIKIIDKNNY